MKIYIAGPSKDLSLAETWIARCRTAGFEITHDWVAAIRHADEGTNPKPAVLINGKYAMASDLDERRRGWSLTDIDGVTSADVLWLLVDKNAPSTGSWVELGYALAQRSRYGAPHTIVASGDVYESIFTALATVCCRTHEEAFANIESLIENERQMRRA